MSIASNALDFLLKIFVKNGPIEDPEVRRSYGNFAGSMGIIINFLMSVIQVGLGYITGSVAIMSDGAHNVMDLFASGVAILSFKIAGRKPDLSHPYGHGRVEYLFSIAVSIIVIVVGIQFFIESAGKVWNPEPVNMEFSTLGIYALTLLGNLTLLYMYGNIANRINSQVLRAAKADSFSDLLSTLAIVVGLSLEPLAGIALDGYLGIFASFMILHTGYEIFSSATSALVGNEADPEEVEKICSFIRAYPGVLGIHDLMIHNYGPGKNFASLHIELDENTSFWDAHQIIEEIEEDALHELGIIFTIHADPVRHDEETIALYHQILSIVRDIEPEGSIHDLRIVDAAKGKHRVVFDMALPYKAQGHEKEIVAQVTERVEAINPLYEAKIMIDYSYVGGIDVHEPMKE